MRQFLLCFALFGFAIPALAQGTAADYERANKLGGLYANKVTRDKVDPTWFADGKKFWYANDLGQGKKEFVVVDAVEGTRTVVKENELPKGKGAISPRVPPKGNSRSSRSAQSPDGKWTAIKKGENVWLREKQSSKEVQLTKDGTAKDYYVEQFYWSPDSTRLVVHREKAGGDRNVTIVESSPKDQLQPKSQTYFYLKPGDAIPQPKPHLFDIAKMKEIPVSDELFKNPWDVSYEHWSADSKQFFFFYNQRGHTVMRVNAIDTKTGDVTAIVNEECKTFFDYSAKLYLRYIDSPNELIWMSERDGWNHLYLIDSVTGKVKNPITKGNWVVRGVDRVDTEKREIWFRAMGLDEKQDPYHVHFCRVNFDGTGLTRLTAGDGMHAVQYSPDGKYLIDTYSRVDLAPVTELRCTSDGKLVCKLEAADVEPLTRVGWKAPERFTAKGRDGKTDIYGVIYRPSNFDPSKKYHVIEDIYAGPHDHFVPKRFRPSHGTAQAIAELGFVVVKIDGMGTNWRSKAFHDVAWKNLGDAGFPDRIAWIKAAAKEYEYLDLSKGVGIYGGSAGGQSTVRGMTEYPDFYTVGVADCGCHDNRMDKIWWNELWMSWPVGPHYASQSNVTNAHKITGKLLLVVGELDRNVDPASTMQVANALIKANKDFDLLVMPSTGHGAAENPYGRRRRMDFFVRNLMGVEPRR